MINRILRKAITIFTVPPKGFVKQQKNHAHGVKGKKPLIPKIYVRSHELLLLIVKKNQKT